MEVAVVQTAIHSLTGFSLLKTVRQLMRRNGSLEIIIPERVTQQADIRAKGIVPVG